MAKSYRGHNLIGRVKPEKAPGHSITVQMRPGDVHLFMDLIMGYGHLAFPAETNPKEGLIVLHTTPDCYDDLLAIIATLPLALQIR
jgi:hypothetical protein